jgi:hypothetical protein
MARYVNIKKLLTQSVLPIFSWSWFWIINFYILFGIFFWRARVHLHWCHSFFYVHMSSSMIFDFGGMSETEFVNV